MSHIRQMLSSHPAGSVLEHDALARCLEACLACQQSCTTCADACLNEEGVSKLLHCIRTDQDCADVCTATVRILSRLTEPSVELVQSQLESLATACRICAAECEKHAGMHEHCRICAEVCRECESACRDLLNAVPAAA